MFVIVIIGRNLVTGQRVFACAPRTNAELISNWYWHRGNREWLRSARGTCLKLPQVRDQWDNRDILTPQSPDYYPDDGWGVIGIMGHSVVGNQRGDLIVGAPFAQTLSEYVQVQDM